MISMPYALMAVTCIASSRTCPAVSLTLAAPCPQTASGCYARDDAQADLLWTAHLSPRGQGTTWTSITLPTGNLYCYVVWSPDGENRRRRRCWSCPVQSLCMMSRLRITRYASPRRWPCRSWQAPSYCALDWLGWSPDGRHLALSGRALSSPVRFYVVDLTNLPAPDTQIARDAWCHLIDHQHTNCAAISRRRS